MTCALISPAFSLSYGLIQKKWFSKLQFQYLRIRKDLFDDYYRDTSKISKDSMIAFLKANTVYGVKPDLGRCRTQLRIVVGEKEKKPLLRSAVMLHKLLPDSVLEIKNHMRHGEYSLNHPEEYVKDLLKTTER